MDNIFAIFHRDVQARSEPERWQPMIRQKIDKVVDQWLRNYFDVQQKYNEFFRLDEKF